MRAPTGSAVVDGRRKIRPVELPKAPRGAFFVFWWAIGPIFVCSGFELQRKRVAMSVTLRERLIALIEPVLAQLGYELVELEYAAGRSQAVVRLFIDTAAGISVDDCERVSRDVAALLDVDDPIPTAYTLEVSSPGFDRVLRTPAHFERFVSERVYVELRAPRAGRKRYTGLLQAVTAAGIELEVDKQTVQVPFGEIAKARLAPLMG
jgi:ribosome maturation factor RimP